MRTKGKPAAFVAGVVLAVLVTGCQWNAPRYDIGGTGNNTAETTLTLANVGGLHEAWATVPIGLFHSNAVTSPSTLFMANLNTLEAFDLGGTTGCGGSPKVCQPTWTAPLAGFGQPVVSGGMVYASGAAFDAAGTTGCGGSPKVCQPLFTTASNFATSVVVGGLLYATPQVTGSLALEVYDAAGVTGCSGSPKVCAPLRSYQATCGATQTCQATQPVVEADRVFVGMYDHDDVLSTGRVVAFDRLGSTGCTGSPAVCQPLWQSTIGAPAGVAVANGVVYASGSAGGFGSASHVDTFFALSAANGSTIWSADGTTTLDAIGNGTVYVGGPNVLLEFPVACSGACSPVRTAPVPGFADGPVLANGVVYSGAGSSLQAFDATGATGCGGAPVVCTPAASIPMPANGSVSAVVGGKVLTTGDDDQQVHVFTL